MLIKIVPGMRKIVVEVELIKEWVVKENQEEERKMRNIVKEKKIDRKQKDREDEDTEKDPKRRENEMK